MPLQPRAKHRDGAKLSALTMGLLGAPLSGDKGKGPSNAQLGMRWFLVSLSVLFAASLVACAMTRANAPLWRTKEMPNLPAGLALSTGLILALSATLETALRAIRANRFRSFERRLWAVFLLAVLFLLAQSFNWAEMARGYRVSTLTLYPFTFHVLTGLHAAHVVGGFVPLGIVMSRASRREYTSSRYEGVKLCRDYWHFLGGVWLVLVMALWLMSR
jgi:cytochrome c oxidase subunit 3